MMRLQEFSIVVVLILFYVFFMRDFVIENASSSFFVSMLSSGSSSSPTSSSDENKEGPFDGDFTKMVTQLRRELGAGKQPYSSWMEALSALTGSSESTTSSTYSNSDEETYNKLLEPLEVLQSLDLQSLERLHHALMEETKQLEEKIDALYNEKRLEQLRISREELSYPIRTQSDYISKVSVTMTTMKQQDDLEVSHHPRSILEYVTRTYEMLPSAASSASSSLSCLPFTKLKLAVGVSFDGRKLSKLDLERGLRHLKFLLNNQRFTEWMAFVYADRYSNTPEFDSIARLVFEDDPRVKLANMQNLLRPFRDLREPSTVDGWAMAMSLAMDHAEREQRDLFVVMDLSTTWAPDHLSNLLNAYLMHPDAGVLYLSVTAASNDGTTRPREWDRTAYNRMPRDLENDLPELTSTSIRLDRVSYRFRTSLEALNRTIVDGGDKSGHSDDEGDRDAGAGSDEMYSARKDFFKQLQVGSFSQHDFPIVHVR